MTILILLLIMQVSQQYVLIFGIVIEAFSRVCKFSIFEIRSISQSKKNTYGILRTDWKTHFKCEEISSVFACRQLNKQQLTQRLVQQ
jgi:hypothetical protein